MSTRFRARTRFGRPSYVAVTRRSNAQKAKYLWRVSRGKKTGKGREKERETGRGTAERFSRSAKYCPSFELPHLVGARARSCDRDSEIIPITFRPLCANILAQPSSTLCRDTSAISLSLSFVSASIKLLVSVRSTTRCPHRSIGTSRGTHRTYIFRR